MHSKLRTFVGTVLLAGATAAGWLVFGQNPNDPRIWQHRNLGKAFYENPTTHPEAVQELRQALALAPNSVREQLNYGLARASAAGWLVFGQNPNDPRIWQHRNLGKAFYENPTTHPEAVQELRQALDRK